MSELYSSECTRIEQLSVCKEEKRQLRDILNIMTRSMSKSKKADVPVIYLLKVEHRKPKHTKPQEVQKQTVVEQVEQEHTDLDELADSDEIELPILNEVPLQVTPWKVHDQPVLQERPEIYSPRVKRPNPLLEPSSYPQVMTKQLPKYVGLLKPQPIEIELRVSLPSYNVDKAIEKYPFTMDTPSIEELKDKRKLFHRIPEDTVFRRHIPKQVELDKFIDALKEKVINDCNIPINVKALRALLLLFIYSRIHTCVFVTILFS